jgi:Family of unknown function (DUF5681)
MAKKAKRATAKRVQKTGSKVGRGNPPKHSQFPKGKTGNPKGRPKGSKNLMTLIMQAAGDPVTATVGGKTRTISKLHATTMQLATKAAGGDPGSIAKFLDWVDKIETRAAATRPTQFPLSAPDIEVLRAAYDRMKECRPAGDGE